MSVVSTPQWRRYAATALQRTPAPVRRAYWRRRRAAERARRRELEARGDYSLSRPASFDIDSRLSERMGLHGGGEVFVEAGGFDGYLQSNTYYLERVLGWRGVLVEPVPFLAREARLERPNSQVFNVALVPEGHPEPTLSLRYGGTKTIVAAEEGAEAWVAEAQENMALDEPGHVFTVPARTLSSVLDEAGVGQVDLLSLDVEGYEAQVLAGLDLERHAPRFLLVEAGLRRGREEIDSILGERYAEPEQFTPNDLLYERR